MAYWYASDHAANALVGSGADMALFVLFWFVDVLWALGVLWALEDDGKKATADKAKIAEKMIFFMICDLSFC